MMLLSHALNLVHSRPCGVAAWLLFGALALWGAPARATEPVRVSAASAVPSGVVPSDPSTVTPPVLPDEPAPSPVRTVPAQLQGAWQSVAREVADVPTQLSMVEQGTASFLWNGLQGRRTASGERYNMNELTAAHKTLPFGTQVIVRSLETGREVVVRITDRGPFLKDRIIDLSRAAARALGIQSSGIAEVQVMPVQPAR